MQSLLKILILTSFTLPGFLVEARESVLNMKGFELTNCNLKKKCIRVKATEAKSGNFSPLIVLKNPEIEIIQKPTTRIYKGELAYYSMEENKIVLTLKDESELEINLTDLSEKKFN